MAPGQKENTVHKDVAPETQMPTPSMAGETVWDEDKVERALKTLKEMHIQLRELRTTIPRLIAPLSDKQARPESIFRDFHATSKLANQEVQQFKELMKDDSAVQVMEQAKRSRLNQPLGIRPWKVTEHADWLRRR